MSKFKFDVMQNGFFVKTFELPYYMTEDKVREFVESRLPSLNGKKYEIEYYD